jgi:hypothetical protein
MTWRHARAVFGVVMLAAALASAPVAASASTHKAKQHKVVKHHTAAHPKKTSKTSKTSKPKSGSSSTALACTDLGGEQSQSSQLSTAMEKAFTSGNFTTMKQALLTEFTDLNQALTKAESELGSAPANVKAAFTTIANAFQQLTAAVQSSTSLPQLETAFTALGQNTQLEAASSVLASYYGSLCGTTTTTT